MARACLEMPRLESCAAEADADAEMHAAMVSVGFRLCFVFAGGARKNGVGRGTERPLHVARRNG